ncbi:radical SAM protein [Streptomyces griseus]|uniref:radical SAM protein n=1 Tax=Streptomyces griseus TaxID=1911 RepID=UPI0004C72B79|nr:radical SAM protein [Streptomyces griseus]
MTSTGTPPAGPFESARFYITFRCNSLCGYCNVWQDDKFKGYEELTLDQGRRILDELHGLGVRYVDFTGGEPVLHPHIDGIVQYAKKLGMTVEITSNGIRFAKHIDAIVPYVDTMNVSLDTLRPERYRAIRGVPTLDRALDVIRSVVARGDAGHLKLICVVTRENADEVPDLLRFAQENRVTVYFSTMFEYFDEQDTVRDVNRTARKLKLVEQNGRPAGGGCAPERPAPAPDDGSIPDRLLELLHAPFALVNLHFRKYVETQDPTAPTQCYANKRILTVGPDGRLVLPCYHAFDNSVTWERPLAELVRDEEFRRVRDEEVGFRPECRGCTVFPYVGLSFSYRFDKVFLYQALSEEIAKLKTRFANPLFPRLAVETGPLLAEFAALERFIDEELPAAGMPLTEDHLYRFDVTDTGVRTDFGAGETSVEEVLADHAGEQCWGVQRSPHTWVRLLYRELLPLLGGLADRELIPREAYEELVGRAYAVQLAWWRSYLGRHYRGGAALDTRDADATVSRFLASTAALLPAAPESGRVREILLHAGCVLALPAGELAPLASRTPFPEADLLAKHLLLLAPGDRLAAYAALLPEPAAAVLRGEPRAAGDDGPLGRLLDASPGTDLPALIDAVRALRAEVPAEELAALLLARELRDPALVRRRGAALRARAGSAAGGAS